MFDYDAERLRRIVLELTRSTISADAWAWLEEKLTSKERGVFYTVFSLMPRKTGKGAVLVTAEIQKEIDSIKPGLKVHNWSADQLARTCLLMHQDPSDKEAYFTAIENLFRSGEMAELVALYGALPVLVYPELWIKRCAEGIRSNIGIVLESIMYDNPFPAKYLDEQAWNQLVMKAFFTDKDIARIQGISERANEELSLILSDYAHERWAAGRSINPQLWRVAGFHLSDRLVSDLRRVMVEGSDEEKTEAGRLLAAIG